MQKIVIENFGSIKKAEIEIPRFLILTGEQASGKSTIAKLIYFFQNLREDFHISFKNIIEQNSIISLTSFLFNRIENKFINNFKSIINYSKNFKIDFYLDLKNENKKITIYYSNEVKVAFLEDYFKDFFNESNNLANELIEIKKNLTNKEFKIRLSLYQAKLKKHINNLFDNNISIDVLLNNYDILYIPDNRSITTSYKRQFKSYFVKSLPIVEVDNNNQFDNIEDTILSNFINYTEGLIDWFDSYYENKKLNILKNKFSTLIKGTYTVKGDSESIVLENGLEYPLSLSSSGQREVIRILQDIIFQVTWNNIFYRIIEEPESHLFPSSQILLSQILAYATNHNQSSLIITTHSPYIVAAFNHLLYAYKVHQLAKEKGLENILEEEFWSNSKVSFFDKNCMIPSDEFRAYFLKDGKQEMIYNAEVSMFENDTLDNAFEELSETFEKLYAIKGKILRHV
jgi:predicted ATPase